MTATLIYANRGRQLIWLGAAANLYMESTDDELTIDDARALGFFSIATIALFIPDPEATALGWGATKFVNAAKSAATTVLTRANTGFTSVSRWWLARSIAQKSAILYVAFTPIILAAAQNEKARTGVEGWDEALGEAMWEAQAVPGTERLQVPKAVNPLAGGRVF